jgi:hypothetical protein
MCKHRKTIKPIMYKIRKATKNNNITEPKKAKPQYQNKNQKIYKR